MAENFGVSGSRAFYEEVGTIRDVCKTMLQVVTLLAMDAPAGHDADTMQAEKTDASSEPCSRSIRKNRARQFRAIGTKTAWPRIRRSKLSPRCVCVSIPGAGRTWPFFIRAGKNLPVTATECGDAQAPPLAIFDPATHAFRIISVCA